MNVPKLNSNARVTEVDTVARQIVTAVEKSSWVNDPYIPTMCANLKTLSGEMNIAIKSTKAESTLEEKDSIRDGQIRGMSLVLNGFLLHPMATIKDAATKVHKVFSKYGVSMITENYRSQSSLVRSMLDDFAAADIASAIAKLPTFDEIVSALATAQDEFDGAEAEWNIAKGNSTRSASDLKREVLEMINDDFVSYLRIASKMNKPLFEPLAKEVSEYIETANRAVKQR